MSAFRTRLAEREQGPVSAPASAPVRRRKDRACFIQTYDLKCGVKADEDKLGQTKVAVLNAAERLFAAHGFRATSVRAITDLAGANLGAVNYHFASKDELILAVLRRRMKPLNAERLALLDQFEI